MDNEKLTTEGLPVLHYRISADYGRVDLAKSLTSTGEDIFGPTDDRWIPLIAKEHLSRQIGSWKRPEKSSFPALFHTSCMS